MNKTKIEWTDFSWNPVTGCHHGCEYCYARALANRIGYGFGPRFWPNRLHDPLKIKRCSKIFVSSMGDLFGEWVPQEWINAVLDIVRQAPRHSFQFLTKNPERLSSQEWRTNAWVGASAVTQAMADRAIVALSNVRASVRFLSCEPLHEMIDLGDICLDWLIIGAQTGPAAFQPERKWVDRLLDFAAERHTPVFLKPNLRGYATRREFPPLAT